MYISANLSFDASGGRVLSEANLEILKAVSNADIKVLSVGRVRTTHKNIKSTSNTFETALANLQLFSGGLHASAFDSIMNEINNAKPSILYLDRSLFGRLGMSVKKKFPEIKIITFFHNIEFDFRLQCNLGLKRIFYIPAILSDWMNERWAIRYSDIVVVLHKKDSLRLEQLYGRKADFIHPICFADNTIESSVYSEKIHTLPDKYILFVGSAFSANLEAIKFLCDEVMPFLNEDLIVIGSNMEKYQHKFSSNNVSIVGSVSDLAPYYANAKLVVTPIFAGAGMKVKVAEALMHGKCVIGSRFSFIGYEDAVDSNVCMVASSAGEYIDIIKNFKPLPVMESLAKNIFAKEFSFSSGSERMKQILDMVRKMKSNVSV